MAAKPLSILWVGDSPTPSGFGRIANEVCTRLVQRGHQVFGVSVLYDGAMPHKLPFWVAGVAGRDIWAYVYNLVNMTKPDVVVVCQDFPYLQTALFNIRMDWSVRAFLGITPIDGTPIFPDWLRVVDEADAMMVISEFGVEAMRQEGRKVALCPPGIDRHVFYPATSDERQALRAKANIPKDAFVVGMAAMNQGRKAIPHTIRGFIEFARDKPEAILFLDMDKASPAGWNIPMLTDGIAKRMQAKVPTILYKEDLEKRGLVELRDRFCVLDVHSVLSHREGFGLPLIESMACRIPSCAMAWCSGDEIVGNGKGYLIKRNEATERDGTWGDARDYDPDIPDFVRTLNAIYSNPTQAAMIAEAGYQYAIARTWDRTADTVEEALNQARGKFDARHSGNPGLRRPGAFDEIHGESASAPSAQSAGSSADRRLQSAIQLEGTAGSAVPNPP